MLDRAAIAFACEYGCDETRCWWRGRLRGDRRDAQAEAGRGGAAQAWERHVATVPAFEETDSPMKMNLYDARCNNSASSLPATTSCNRLLLP